MTFYLEDALATLLLWRGHFPVRIGSKVILLPLHSLAAFLVSVSLVERPEYLPSFFFASIVWIMMAVLGWRNDSPNVWRKCTSYKTIAQKILTGHTPSPHQTIEPFQNWEQAKSDIDKFMERITESQKRASIAEQKASKEILIREKQEEERLEDLRETDTTTKTQGIEASVNPVGRSLLPFQLALGMLCRSLRFVKNVVIWEEAYFSFWVVSSCIFLSVACLFIPWFWIIRWSSRLFVWTIFGPWMKLLDIYWHKIKELKETAGDSDSMWEQVQAARSSDAKSERRVKKENAKKMKKMKQYMFGKFSVEIPILKLDRYADVPLPDSAAKPCQAKELTLAELAMDEAGYNRTRLPGQNLVGDMIPAVSSMGRLSYLLEGIISHYHVLFLA